MNEGQVTVDPAGLMYVSQTYNAAGGTITGPGYVFNGILLVTVSTASPTTILVDGATTLATNNLPNTTIWVQGNASLRGQNATLTVAAGLTNDGTILLESQSTTYSDTLSTGSGTFTNAADGIIQVTAGPAARASITGNLTNLGAINVGAGTTLFVNNTSTAATFLNEGQVTVDPAGLMYVSQTYNAAGGTITGPGYVFQRHLTCHRQHRVTDHHPGRRHYDPGHQQPTQHDDLGAGQRLSRRAERDLDRGRRPDQRRHDPPGVAEHHLYRHPLHRQRHVYQRRRRYHPGHRRDRRPRSITGNLTNLGAINVGAGTTLFVNNTSTAATFLNEGQVTVDPAGLMYVSQTYNAGGGTITGPGYVYNGTLLVTVSTASPTTILVDGTTTLATNNLPNTTIWVQGNAFSEG